MSLSHPSGTGRRRVVITGMGCVTPMGVGVSALWEGLLGGRSGVDHIRMFDASTWPSRIGAEVRGLDIEAEKARRPELAEAGRNTMFAVVAAEEAGKQAGLDPSTPLGAGPWIPLGAGGGAVRPERMGVYLGAGEGVPDTEGLARVMAGSWDAEKREVDKPRYMKLGTEIHHGMRELEQEPNLPGGHVAIMFNAQGPNCGCLTACAASNQALGEALELIRHDDADVMIAGGAHSMLHPLGLTGFCLLTALSTRNDAPKRASRPFDAGREGFLLGEGAAMVVLEELEHAKARGATIYAEVLGYGSSADAFRLTDSHENGRGAIACMRDALADAGISPDEVDYINAHGTSTKVNDRVESLAVKEVFGERAYQIPVSATKSMTGHLIAAAGATEAIICVKAIETGIVPPTINQEEADPDCDLDYVPNEPRKHHVDVAMTNSFGFGGQNISLVLRRYDGP